MSFFGISSLSKWIMFLMCNHLIHGIHFLFFNSSMIFSMLPVSNDFEWAEKNNFLLENLYLGRFHTHLIDVFAPMVIRYIGKNSEQNVLKLIILLIQKFWLNWYKISRSDGKFNRSIGTPWFGARDMGTWSFWLSDVWWSSLEVGCSSNFYHRSKLAGKSICNPSST